MGDIIASARALMVLPAKEQAGCLDLLLVQAHAAHLFHKRKMTPHPQWGNGSLMARANIEPQVAEPFTSDVAYLQALQRVIGALILRSGQCVVP